MAAKTQYLTYYIVLTDPDEVARLQALPEYLAAGGIIRAPETGAAIEFAAPWTSWRLGLPGDPPNAPYTWSPWTGASGGGSNTPFPTNVATFTRHSGGIFGLGGTTIKYYWLGLVQYAGSPAEPPGGLGAGSAPDLEYAPFALRRWVCGFNNPQSGPFSRTSAGGGYSYSYDAGRATGQRGLALRGPNNDNGTVAPTDYRAGAVTAMWQRMYIRLRKLPAGVSVNFWSTRGSPTASNGIALDINASGQLTVYTLALSPARSVLGTVDPALVPWTGLSSDDAWRRLDMLIEYANGTANGYFRLFIDGALQASFTIPSAAGGLGNGTSMQSTVLGESGNSGSNTLELDLADFIGADLPAGQNSLGTNGNDTNGVARSYIYNPVALYVVGDLTHTADGHVYKCIKNIATAVPADGTITPSPSAGGTFWHRYEGRDWLNGSRVLLSKAKGFGANHSVNWTGNYRMLEQVGFYYLETTGPQLTSSTASAVAEAEMDVGEMIDTEPGAIGAAALMVHVNSSRGASSGQLGYKFAGGAAVDAAIVETVGRAWNAVLYPGPVGVDAVDISPLQARYIKGPAADAAVLKSLLVEVELLGIFDRHDFRPTPDGGAWSATTQYAAGDVVNRKQVWYVANAAPNLPGVGQDPSAAVTPAKWDIVPIPAYPRFVGQHNAPYRRSPYAIGGAAPPISPFIVHTGTYTGNATGQDLVFRSLPGLVFIRPLTGGAGGVCWWPGMSGSHRAWNQSALALINDAAEDFTFVPALAEDTQEHRYTLRISGVDSQLNANAVTYQYVVVMDPGARFMLNLSVSHNSNLTSDVDNPLIDPTFTPDWLFAFIESLDATSTSRLYAKGPGSPAATLSVFGAAAVSNALTLGAGKITTKSAFHAFGAQLAVFNCWRRADGNNDPNQASVVNIGSYTGDGSASRTINIAPASGKRPVFAFVFSDSSTGCLRDPSHTTTNSTNSSGADTTTGITGGGIDSISVGSTLNSNGVVYNYFILFAGVTAGNGGWGVNGEYFPVEADSPTGGPWPPTPAEPVDPGTIPVPAPEPLPGEPDLDPDTPLPGTDLFCVDFTQKLANQALSRIGVNKRIKDLANETTLEADTVRLHIKQDVEATLRRYPWPFATGYADLAVVAGAADAPVNQDWTYSYRAPADMVAARRLVNQAGLKRTADPRPPEFRIGGDTNGALIYADADILSEDLQLEYTARNRCPAYFGDAVFRDALIWRIAASCAPSLSRDAKMAGYCLEMFEAIFSKAITIAANESQPTNAAGDAPWIVDRG